MSSRCAIELVCMFCICSPLSSEIKLNPRKLDKFLNRCEPYIENLTYCLSGMASREHISLITITHVICNIVPLWPDYAHKCLILCDEFTQRVTAEGAGIGCAVASLM